MLKLGLLGMRGLLTLRSAPGSTCHLGVTKQWYGFKRADQAVGMKSEELDDSLIEQERVVT